MDVPHATWKASNLGFDAAVARLPEALKKEGFGVITQIDLQETFRAKLDVPFRRYRIFGACHPGFAHRAVSAEPRIGALLPCNVVLYEDDEGRTIVGAVDPMQTLGRLPGASEGPVAELARDVAARLGRVLEDLGG
ncbi:MAG: DUF302 domain-containing protein [Polyangiaceae bacterium]